MNKKTYSKFMKASVTASVVASAFSSLSAVSTEAANPFPDVKSTSDYFGAVQNLVERQIIQGYPDGKFYPQKEVTRGQAAKIIASVLNLDTKNVKNPNFKDVNSQHEFYGAIAALANKGIISGYSTGQFKPNEPIQRAHMAKIIAKSFELEISKNATIPFTDVHDEFAGYVSGLYENGIVNGKTPTLFGSKETTTRGQLALMISRAEKAPTTVVINEITNKQVKTSKGNYAVSDSLKAFFAANNSTALKNATLKVTTQNGVITGVQRVTIKTSGTAEKSVVLDGSNITIAGDIIVDADYLTIQNLTASGHITLSKKVVNRFNMDRVQTKGELVVEENDGPTAVASLNHVAVIKAGPSIQMKNSSVKAIHAKRDDVSIDSDKKLPEVKVSAKVKSIEINADVEKVVINVVVKLEIKGKGSINSLSVEQANELALNIAGQINEMLVKNKDSKIDVGQGLKIVQLVLPEGSKAEQVIVNFDVIKDKIQEILDSKGDDSKPDGPAEGNIGGNTGGNTGSPADKIVVDPGTAPAAKNPTAPTLTNTNPANFSVTQVGRYDSGKGEAGTEIMAYDATRKLAFVTNGAANGFDIMSFAGLKTGQYSAVESTKRVVLADYGIAGVNNITSIAAHPTADLIAIAAYGEKTEKGYIVFADKNGKYVKHVQVGYLPDAVTFTPDGKSVVVANEGEPNDEVTNDPEGSISVIDTASFEHTNLTFTETMLDDNVRMSFNGKDKSYLQQLEPEYVSISADSQTAYVSLQENNAIATVDLTTKSITSVKGLGVLDHSVAGNEMDAHNDKKVNIAKAPILTFHMPDAIDTFTLNGTTYIITPNEGDSRDYTGYSEVVELSALDATKIKLKAENYKGYTQADLDAFNKASIGTYKITKENGLNADGAYEALYGYGGRSFSIFNASTMQQVFDSGNQFETIINEKTPALFNINSDKITADNRSDDKGPEPESAVVGVVDGTTYAFIGLERYSAIMVYDVSNPAAPEFVTMLSTRDFTVAKAGDVSPEGLKFIPASESPTGKALLVATHEVSGTVAVYELGAPTKVAANEFSGTTGAPKTYNTSVKVDISEIASLENAVINGDLILTGTRTTAITFSNITITGNLNTSEFTGDNTSFDGITVSGDTTM